MSTPSIRKRFVVWPWGLAFAVVWLFVFERMVARRGWVWDFNEYSSTGTITALERRIIAKAPAPKIVLLGNSRMRDAISPRQLEDELGCAKGTVMNLAVSAGGTFEAKALYERNKKKLSRADVVVLNVDTWYLDETEPPTMNVRRFGSLSDRVGIYGWRETASLVVGWAWRSYDVRERYDGLLTAWLEDKKSSHLKILPDGRVHFRKNSGEDGPQRIRPAMTGLAKLVFVGGREDELARFVAEVSASGPRVLLVALPLRDRYRRRRRAGVPRQARRVRAAHRLDPRRRLRAPPAWDRARHPEDGLLRLRPHGAVGDQADDLGVRRPRARKSTGPARRARQMNGPLAITGEGPNGLPADALFLVRRRAPQAELLGSGRLGDRSSRDPQARRRDAQRRPRQLLVVPRLAERDLLRARVRRGAVALRARSRPRGADEPGLLRGNPEGAPPRRERRATGPAHARPRRIPVVARHRSPSRRPRLLAGKPVGILCHEHVGGTRVWTDSDQEFVLAVGQALAARVEASARGKSEIAAERAMLLSRTAARLAKVMAPEAVAKAAVKEALTAFADMSTVTLFEDATLRLRAAAHATTEGQRAIDEVFRRSPARRDAEDFISRAFVERQSLVIPSVGSTSVSSFAAERGVTEALTAALGVHSAMVVPFLLRGDLTGGMTFSSIARVYDQDDLRFAEEYARLIGGNLENALLHEQALRAIRTRDDFLSLASHELCTPLAALRASTGAIAREVEKGPAAEAATLTRLSDVVARQVDRLDRLNDRMLDASELAGGLAMHVGTADLVEIANRAVHALAVRAERVGSAVALDADAAVVGRWDAARLEQALSDLLDNAIKFGAGRPIEIGVHARDGFAVATVGDHGIGIPADQVDRIFERYHRAVSARSYGGLGLGLWAVTAADRGAHFGRITVQSHAGEGTTFTMTLPLRGASTVIPEGPA